MVTGLLHLDWKSARSEDTGTDEYSRKNRYFIAVLREDTIRCRDSNTV